MQPSMNGPSSPRLQNLSLRPNRPGKIPYAAEKGSSDGLTPDRQQFNGPFLDQHLGRPKKIRIKEKELMGRSYSTLSPYSKTRGVTIGLYN